MATCANCDTSAAYRLADPGAEPVDLCASHVPPHLQGRLASGEFSLDNEVTVSDIKAEEAAQEQSPEQADKETAKALKGVKGRGSAAQASTSTAEPTQERGQVEDNRVSYASVSDSPEQVASGSSVPEEKDEKK
jgi:hypothetical protein